MSISKLCLKLQVARGDVINFYIQNKSKPLNTLNKALEILFFKFLFCFRRYLTIEFLLCSFPKIKYIDLEQRRVVFIILSVYNIFSFIPMTLETKHKLIY